MPELSDIVQPDRSTGTAVGFRISSHSSDDSFPGASYITFVKMMWSVVLGGSGGSGSWQGWVSFGFPTAVSHPFWSEQVLFCRLSRHGDHSEQDQLGTQVWPEQFGVQRVQVPFRQPDWQPAV